MVSLRKPDAEPKKGIRSYMAIALSSALSKLYATCVVLRPHGEKVPGGWKQLYVGGVDEIGCLHSQGMVYPDTAETLRVTGHKERHLARH